MTFCTKKFRSAKIRFNVTEADPLSERNERVRVRARRVVDDLGFLNDFEPSLAALTLRMASEI